MANLGEILGLNLNTQAGEKVSHDRRGLQTLTKIRESVKLFRTLTMNMRKLLILVWGALGLIIGNWHSKLLKGGG